MSPSSPTYQVRTTDHQERVKDNGRYENLRDAKDWAVELCSVRFRSVDVYRLDVVETLEMRFGTGAVPDIDAPPTLSVAMSVPITTQLLRDLLCTAVEGGSNYWARFRSIRRTEDLDYLEVEVKELESSTEKVALDRMVTAEELVGGLQKMAATNTPASMRHLMNALTEDGDAETADVVLQYTVFGEVVYG